MIKREQRLQSEIRILRAVVEAASHNSTDERVLMILQDADALLKKEEEANNVVEPILLERNDPVDETIGGPKVGLNLKKF